jgi:molybdenum cofactor cytidylyltransferase
MISRRIGVLLAAGRSRRMGRTKQLVTWQSADGPKPLVAAAFDAICPVCDDMVVVVGHDADAVLAALGERLFHSTRSDPDAPMFDSIRAGLQRAKTLDSAAVVLLQPGDHPAVAFATLHALMDWSLQRPAQAIIPEYDGRGGHPILIPPTVAKRVLAANCPDGLGEFWTAHPELCCRIPVNDQAVVRDIDTQVDLDREASLS